MSAVDLKESKPGEHSQNKFSEQKQEKKKSPQSKDSHSGLLKHWI